MSWLRSAMATGIAAVAMTLAAAAGAYAQDELELRPADQAGMEQCLQSASERGVAQDECIGFVLNPCRETEEGQSTAGAIECIGREHAFWDRLLNQTYADLRDDGGAESNAALRDVQRQWIAWRAARCGWAASLYEGGSLGRVVANECFNQETARRAIDLVGAFPDGDHFRLREAE